MVRLELWDKEGYKKLDDLANSSDVSIEQSKDDYSLSFNLPEVSSLRRNQLVRVVEASYPIYSSITVTSKASSYPDPASNDIQVPEAFYNSLDLGNYILLEEGFDTAIDTTSNADASAGSFTHVSLLDVAHLEAGMWIRLDDGTNYQYAEIKVVSGSGIYVDLGYDFASGTAVTGPIRKQVSRVLMKWEDGTYHLGLSRLHYDELVTARRANWQTFRVVTIEETHQGVSITCNHITKDLANIYLSKHGSYSVDYKIDGEGIVGPGQGTMYEYLFRILSWNQIEFTSYDDWVPVGASSFLPGTVLDFEYSGGTVTRNDSDDSKLNFDGEPVDYEDEWERVGPNSEVYIEGDDTCYTAKYLTQATIMELDNDLPATTDKSYLVRNISSYHGDTISTGYFDNVSGTSKRLQGQGTTLYTETIHNGMLVKLLGDYHSYVVNRFKVDDTSTYDDDLYLSEYPRLAGTDDDGITYELKPDRRPVSFSNDTLWSALSKVCEAFSDTYHKTWIQVNEDLTIDLRCKLLPETVASKKTIRYQSNLENITRQTEEVDYYNRILPQGDTSGWKNAEAGEIYSLDDSERKDQLVLAGSNTAPYWSTNGNGYLRYGDPLCIYRNPLEAEIVAITNDFIFIVNKDLTDYLGGLLFINSGDGKGQITRVEEVVPDGVSGEHDGGDNKDYLEDSSKDFEDEGVLEGMTLVNLTKDEEATITDVDDDRIDYGTGIYDFDDDDIYEVKWSDITVVERFDIRPKVGDTFYITDNRNGETLYAHVEGFGKREFNHHYNLGIISGTTSGSSSYDRLIDLGGVNFVNEGVFTGMRAYNESDLSSGTVVDGTTTSLHVPLSGGGDNSWDIGDSYAIQGNRFFEVDKETYITGTSTAGSTSTSCMDSSISDYTELGIEVGDIIYDLDSQGEFFYGWGVLNSVAASVLNFTGGLNDGDGTNFASGHTYVIVKDSIANMYGGGMLTVTHGTGKSQSYLIEKNDDLRFYVGEIDVQPDLTTRFGVIAPPRLLLVDYPVYSETGDDYIYLSQPHRSDCWIGGYAIVTQGVTANGTEIFNYREITGQSLAASDRDIDTNGNGGAGGVTLTVEEGLGPIFTAASVGMVVTNRDKTESRVVTAYTSDSDADVTCTVHADISGWDEGDEIRIYRTRLEFGSNYWTGANDMPSDYDQCMVIKDHSLPVSLPDQLDFLPSSDDMAVLLLKESGQPLTIGKNIQFRARILASGMSDTVYIACTDASAYQGPFEPGQLVFIGAKELSSAYSVNTWRGDQVNGHVYEIDYIDSSMVDNGSQAIGAGGDWVDTIEGIDENVTNYEEFISIRIKGEFITTPQPGDWIEVVSIQDAPNIYKDGLVERVVSFGSNNPLELYDLALTDIYNHSESKYKYQVSYLDKDLEPTLGAGIRIIDDELGIETTQYVSRLTYNPFNRYETTMELTNPPWYYMVDKINELDLKVREMESNQSIQTATCLQWDQDNHRCLAGYGLCEGPSGNRDGKLLSNKQALTKVNCRGYKPMDTRSIGGDTSHVQIVELEVNIDMDSENNKGYDNALEVPVPAEFSLSRQSKAVVTGFYYEGTSSVPYASEPSAELVRETEAVATVTSSSGDSYSIVTTSSWSVTLVEGMLIHNITDGSYGMITLVDAANNELRFDYGLTGGADNSIDGSDECEILRVSEKVVPLEDGTGGTVKCWYTGTTLGGDAIMRISVFMFGQRDF